LAEILAFLFPGQGHLPSRLPSLSPPIERLYERVEQQGLDLRNWIAAGHVERLSQTDAAQPTVFLDALARVDVLKSSGVEPRIVAGHSLGEYAALVAAGVLSPDAALSLVIQRGRLMAAVPGGMTAVLKLDLEAVEALCAAVGGAATIANFNGAQQFVVSAPPEILNEVERRAAALGGRAIRLTVSGPFHSPAMRAAEHALAPSIGAAPFTAPRLAFVSSVTGRSETDAATLRGLLARQMTAPVRWTDVLRALANLGVTEAVEIGESTVLTQIGKRAGIPMRFSAYEEVTHG
jgi:[acyl-carrier-protein] S-malonyltransferase